jgi:hypothetical protein
VTFYAGGAHYIQILGEQTPEILIDIERLFDCMFQAATIPGSSLC